MSVDEKREQVAKQYEAVAHLAKALGQVHGDAAKMIRSGSMDGCLDRMGNGSARIMEYLGDTLNGMDANDEEEDAFLDPIFEQAHKLFPQAS